VSNLFRLSLFLSSTFSSFKVSYRFSEVDLLLLNDVAQLLTVYFQNYTIIIPAIRLSIASLSVYEQDFFYMSIVHVSYPLSGKAAACITLWFSSCISITMHTGWPKI